MLYEVITLTRTIRLDEYVKFCFDFIPEEERIAHYAACDLAVFPSYYEPFGIVALEAMAMEKTVVVGAAGVSGMREIVICCGEEQCGFHVVITSYSIHYTKLYDSVCQSCQRTLCGRKGPGPASLPAGQGDGIPQ